MNKKWALPIIAIMMVTIFAGCLGDEPKKPLIPMEFTETLDPWADYVDDGDSATQGSWNLSSTNITHITVTLSWVDDEAGTGDDMMKLEVSTGEGNESQETTEGDTGRLEVTMPVDDFKSLSVTVTCVEAIGGPDQWPGPFIIYATPDPGNTFKVDVTYRYLGYQ